MPAVVDQRQRRVPVSTARLARAVDRALAAVGRPTGIVEVAVVDDAEMRGLNAAHRGIRRRTDVLAFPMEAPDAGPLVGQLVIGADAAARQARRWRVPLALELDLLATHGTLHLVGYDDRDPVEAELMHRREREILGATPTRLWHGLLTEEPRSAAGRRPPRWTAERRSPPQRLTAERSRRPPGTAHPRLEPATKRSLQ
jgi:probable rRNA maturation factor